MKDLFDDKEIVSPNNNTVLPLNINFTPDNPVTYNAGLPTSIHPTEGEKKPFEVGIQEEPYHAGVFETAKAQFGRMSDINHVLSAFNRWGQDASPLNDEVPPGWKPTDDQSAFEGVQKENTTAKTRRREENAKKGRWRMLERYPFASVFASSQFEFSSPGCLGGLGLHHCR